MKNTVIIATMLALLCACDDETKTTPSGSDAGSDAGAMAKKGCDALTDTTAYAALTADEKCVEATFSGVPNSSGLILDHKAFTTPSGKGMGDMNGMYFAYVDGYTAPASIQNLGKSDKGKTIYIVARGIGDAPGTMWYVVRTSL